MNNIHKNSIVQLNGNNIINIDELKKNNTPESSFFTNNFSYKKYSPFALEFKRIIATQLFNYGSNISLDIPIVGNVLNRCFFEIELPVLNFTDSLITDPTYIEYKSNKLYNITQEINYWSNMNTTMIQYSNILINGYITANNVLILNNITLSFLQNRILNIFNQYKDVIYQYKLVIDSNIISSIDIIGYILALTTLDVNSVQTTITSMYNNIINYLKYYNSNLNYSNKEYTKVNTGQLLCKWIDYLGHYYFNYFELNINGFTLDNYSNDYLHIKQISTIDNNYLNNYNKMIGNTDDIYMSKGSPNYIYTPLLFSFSDINKSINALPLVGMINSSIQINTMLNTISNLVYLQDWNSMYTTLLNVIIKRKDHTIDSATNTITRADLPYIAVNMSVPEYIYTYTCDIVDSRVLNTVYPGIDSTTILNKYGSYSEKYNTNVLTLDDWIVLMNSIVGNPGYITDTFLPENTKITLAGYHYFIDYNYVLNLIPKPKVALLVEYGYFDNYEKKLMALNNLDYIVETHHEIVLDINDNSLYDSLNDINGLVKDIYIFTREKLYDTGVSQYGKPDHTYFLANPNPIESITLNISNEYNLFEYYSTSEDTYANVPTFNFLNSSTPNGVWFKTFSLNPTLIQPSGCVNMSTITGQNIAVVVNDYNTIYYNSKINPNKLGLQFKIIYSKYNMLKVKNGTADLLYYS